ncbi:MAG: hypothetical protein NC489_28280 [Ruminococcus flavefaciens]|nr:hypothetical protein [Ruminococcus flavefaciens]
MDAKEYIGNQKDIMERLETLEGEYGRLSTLISRLGIDTQRFVSANDPITPGVACKLAFDQNGLILRGEALTTSDIPDLPIEKILNLKDILNRKSDATPKREVPTRTTKKNIVAGTGTKINYDEEGRVLSSSDLLASDIPELPMEKISGLTDRLRVLETQPEEYNYIPEFRVTPGCFPKITYDSSGRVLKGEKLSMDDIPSSLISRLNVIESGMTSFAPRSVISSLQESLSKKLDANDYMTPGTYMKVVVDSKGLVTGYEKVTKKDLPPIIIKDVEGLESSLRKKADQSDFIRLHESVASLVSLGSKLSELSSVKLEVSKKADREEIGAIKNQVDSLSTRLNTIADKIPNDTILGLLNEIKGELSGISGRVATIENKVFGE